MGVNWKLQTTMIITHCVFILDGPMTVGQLELHTSMRYETPQNCLAKLVFESIAGTYKWHLCASLCSLEVGGLRRFVLTFNPFMLLSQKINYNAHKSVELSTVAVTLTFLQASNFIITKHLFPALRLILDFT